MRISAGDYTPGQQAQQRSTPAFVRQQPGRLVTGKGAAHTRFTPGGRDVLLQDRAHRASSSLQLVCSAPEGALPARDARSIVGAPISMTPVALLASRSRCPCGASLMLPATTQLATKLAECAWRVQDKGGERGKRGSFRRAGAWREARQGWREGRGKRELSARDHSRTGGVCSRPGEPQQ